ncbi:glycosyltransferase family 9 protein, partial [Micromonospora maritima]|uniref:glycosyltransferase family 9 protein n=1 Tax=Micromonospora maritima TaxID=986711 RepID=UPI002483A16B
RRAAVTQAHHEFPDTGDQPLRGGRVLEVPTRAHLAAALGVPVVSLFAPTVPFGQWGPYRVPTVRLGDAAAPCRDTRATACPVPGHPCLSAVEPGRVLEALRLLGVPAAVPAPVPGGVVG